MEGWTTDWRRQKVEVSNIYANIFTLLTLFHVHVRNFFGRRMEISEELSVMKM